MVSRTLPTESLRHGHAPPCLPISATLTASLRAMKRSPFDIIICLLLAPVAVHAAPGDVDQGFNPNANGEVDGLAVQPDGKLVIGGFFTTMSGVSRPNGARLNANATLDGGFNPRGNDSMQCVAVQRDGRIVFAGLFTTVGGTSRMRMARVFADGTLDPGFVVAANDQV